MASTENGASPRLSLAIGIWCCLGELEQLGARGQLPLAPRRDHLDVGLQRVIGQLEADLVVALAGGAVGDGIGAGLQRDLDLMLGDQRPRDRGAEQVLALVERVGAEHREDEVPHELFAHVLDVDVLGLDAQQLGLLARRRQFLALAEIGGEGHHLAAIGGLQPLQDDRGVEAAGIGQHDLLDVALLVGPGIRNAHAGRFRCRFGKGARNIAVDPTGASAPQRRYNRGEDTHPMVSPLDRLSYAAQPDRPGRLVCRPLCGRPAPAEADAQARLCHRADARPGRADRRHARPVPARMAGYRRRPVSGAAPAGPGAGRIPAPQPALFPRPAAGRRAAARHARRRDCRPAPRPTACPTTTGRTSTSRATAGSRTIRPPSTTRRSRSCSPAPPTSCAAARWRRSRPGWRAATSATSAASTSAAAPAACENGEEDVLGGNVFILETVGFLVGEVNNALDARGDKNLSRAAAEDIGLRAGAQGGVKTLGERFGAALQRHMVYVSSKFQSTLPAPIRRRRFTDSLVS